MLGIRHGVIFAARAPRGEGGVGGGLVEEVAGAGPADPGPTADELEAGIEPDRDRRMGSDGRGLGALDDDGGLGDGRCLGDRHQDGEDGEKASGHGVSR